MSYADIVVWLAAVFGAAVLLFFVSANVAKRCKWHQVEHLFDRVTITSIFLLIAIVLILIAVAGWPVLMEKLG